MYFVFCSACEAAVTGLIDLFLLGVDVDTITTALEVNITKNIEGVDTVSKPI